MGSAKVGHWLIYVPRESALKGIATFVKLNAIDLCLHLKGFDLVIPRPVQESRVPR